MTDWLVAALHPYDTWAAINSAGGSSPGNSDSMQITEALALAMAGRAQELSLADSPIKEAISPWSDDELSDDVPAEWRFVYVVVVAIVSSRTVDAHADWFKEFAVSQDNPVDLRVIAALLFSAFGALLDRDIESVDVLGSVRDSLPDTFPMIAQAALTNQLARRLLAIRRIDDALANTDRAASVIASARTENASTYAAPYRRVIEALESANESIRLVSKSLTENSSRERASHFDGWEEQDRRSRDALEAYVGEVFNETVRDAALVNRPQTWAASDRVGQTYRYIWINSEMIGHVHRSRLAAKTAGMLGLSRGNSDSESAEAMALLRYCGEIKDFKSALNTVRSQGPLAILREEVVGAAKRISSMTEDRRVARSDLLLVEYGAELLPVRMLTILCDRLVAELSSSVDRDDIGTFRYDQLVWRSLTAVVPLLSEPSGVLDQILSRLQEWDDSLVRLEARRLVGMIDWAHVESNTVERWLGFARQGSENDDQRLALEILIRLARTGMQEPLTVLLSTEGDGDLVTRAAGILDASIGDSVIRLPKSTVLRMAEQCRLSINRMRSDAASGSFGFGGTDALVVAAEMSRRFPEADLWSEVAGALGDPNVAIAHKEGALNWLTHYFDVVPAFVVDELTSSARSLLEGSEQEFLSSGSTGPALRFLSRAGRDVNRDAVVNVFFSLAGSQEDLHRVEAARSAAAVVAFLSVDVVSGVLLQLARDENLFVRVAAARRLPFLLGQPESAQFRYVRSVVESFLKSDGLSRPLASLRGIEELDLDKRTVVAQVVSDVLDDLAERGATEQIQILADALSVLSPNS